MNKIIFISLIAIFSANQAFATNYKVLNVPILKEQIAKGTIIKEDHISTKEMNIGRVAKTVILDKIDIIGLEATRTLRAGNPLYQGYLRVSPDIHRNQSITLSYNVDGIRLSTKGKAMEDGNIGANISIMNENSKKLLIGTVVAKNKVSIE